MALVNYKGINVVTVGLKDGHSVQLMPGINEIENAIYPLFKDHPSVKARIKRNEIQVIDASKVTGQKTIEEMIEHMPRIFDTKLLRRIIKEDGRPEVAQAAKNQLEAILGGAKKDDKKEDNEHFR